MQSARQQTTKQCAGNSKSGSDESVRSLETLQSWRGPVARPGHLRRLLLCAVLIASAGLGHCSIQLPCAPGDPSCSLEGVLALVPSNRPAAFLVGTDEAQVAHSADSGRSWEVALIGPSSYVVNGLAQAGERIFAFGDDGAGNGFFVSSRDLTNWSVPVIVSGDPLIHGDSDGTTLYVVSSNSSLYRIAENGSYNNLGDINTTAGGVTMLEFENGFWFAADDSGGPDPFFLFGTDPAAFSIPSVSSPTDPTTDIAHVNGQYMAVGTVQTFVTNSGSLDNWQVYNSGTVETSICDDGTFAFAATTAGEVKITVDGQTLGAPQSSGLGANPTDIGCNPFVIIMLPGASGNWAYSENGGLNWSPITNPVGTGSPKVIEYFP